ncbi:MAG: glutathione synthetase [Actinomycetaceae bacterium]|nr:glutathione synthetase [Actinomycetaceae bacterium]
MSDPIVTLVTCSELPDLDADEAALPDALRARGVEPRVAVWDDPEVDWSQAGVVVARSVRDYADKREDFLAWARSVPRLLNPAGLMEWNSDKHYLLELSRRGLPTIPTTWLEPDHEYSKHQVHTRFPAFGDFVVKPAVSSGGRGTGRYTATDPTSRGEAIHHAMQELEQGHSVMVQRYLEEIDRSGEVSLVYLNGMPAYRVEKEPMLHPSFRSDDQVQEEVVRSLDADEDEWRWGEQIRAAIHAYTLDINGRDELPLYNRVDIVRGGSGNDNDFYVMEISLIDASLYLSADPQHLAKFADAIVARALW